MGRDRRGLLIERVLSPCCQVQHTAATPIGYWFWDSHAFHYIQDAVAFGKGKGILPQGGFFQKAPTISFAAELCQVVGLLVTLKQSLSAYPVGIVLFTLT